MKLRNALLSRLDCVRPRCNVVAQRNPHQGMQDKFTALLELLHPERKDELMTLALNPEILRDMVFRNHKAMSPMRRASLFSGENYQSHARSSQRRSSGLRQNLAGLPETRLRSG